MVLLKLENNKHNEYEHFQAKEQLHKVTLRLKCRQHECHQMPLKIYPDCWYSWFQLNGSHLLSCCEVSLLQLVCPWKDQHLEIADCKLLFFSDKPSEDWWAWCLQFVGIVMILLLECHSDRPGQKRVFLKFNALLSYHNLHTHILKLGKVRWDETSMVNSSCPRVLKSLDVRGQYKGDTLFLNQQFHH